MIDPVRLAEVKTMLRGGEAPRNELADIPQPELRRLRAEIDRLLPDNSVKSMDLGDELVQQYHKTKNLMDETMANEECAPNQKAQVCNSVVTILAQLVKLQEDLKLQKTMSLMESVLIDSIKLLPQEAKDEFFVEYERMAKKAGLV